MLPLAQRPHEWAVTAMFVCLSAVRATASAGPDDCSPKPFNNFHTLHIALENGEMSDFQLNVDGLAFPVPLSASQPLDLLGNFPSSTKIWWTIIPQRYGAVAQVDGVNAGQQAPEKKQFIVRMPAGTAANGPAVDPPRLEMSFVFAPPADAGQPFPVSMRVGGVARSTLLLLYPPEGPGPVNVQLPVRGSDCGVVEANSHIELRTIRTQKASGAAIDIAEVRYTARNGELELVAQPETEGQPARLSSSDPDGRLATLVFPAKNPTEDVSAAAQQTRHDENPDHAPIHPDRKDDTKSPGAPTQQPEPRSLLSLVLAGFAGSLAGSIVTALVLFTIRTRVAPAAPAPLPASVQKSLFEKTGPQSGLDAEEIERRISVLEKQFKSLRSNLELIERAASRASHPESLSSYPIQHAEGGVASRDREPQARSKPQYGTRGAAEDSLSAAGQRHLQDYAKALSGRKAAEQFIQSTHAFSLQRRGETANGEALMAQSNEDTVGADIWGVLLESGKCLAFPGFTAFNNIAALSASDSRLARERYSGVFDLVSGGGFLRRPAELSQAQGSWVCRRMGELALDT